MYRFILSLYIIISGVTCVAQNLINKDQQWNVMHSYKTVRTRCYRFTSDTVIQGKRYTSLEYSFSEQFDSVNSVFAGYISEDDDKVNIRYLDGKEFTLYDFTVLQGDTLDMGMINLQYPLSFRCDTSEYVTIDGTQRLCLTMTPINESDAAPQKWIQGIGSTAGIVEIGEPQYLSYKSMLLCSHIGDSLIWKSDQGFCYFSNAPEPKKFVFKTDADDVEGQALAISKKVKNTNLIIKIYDTYGDLVLERKIKKEKDLNLDELESGEYVLQLTDAFDRVYALKKIKI